MELKLFDFVYMGMDLFRTYIIYQFMGIFFTRNDIHIRREIASYMAFYLTITALFLFVDIPIVMLICNITGLFLLTLNYSARIKQRIFAAAFISFILLAVEVVVTILTGYMEVPIFEEAAYSSVFGIIALQFVLYAVMLILKKGRNVRNGAVVPVNYWITIVTIPAASLYLVVILFYATGLTMMQILVCVFFILWINVRAFTLYDSLVVTTEHRMEQKMLSQLNNYYEKQFELMQSSEYTIKEIRHDLRNHLIVMREMLDGDKDEDLNEYMVNLIQNLYQKGDYSHSGNVVVDSILNFKLQEATNKEIHFKIEVELPNKLNIEPFDLTVILGNLMDNAIQASEKIEIKDRKLFVCCQYQKGMLIVKIRNRYNGIITYEGDSIVTLKEDKINHGIGLFNIRKTVEKYNGIFETEHSEEDFIATVMLLV